MKWIKLFESFEHDEDYIVSSIRDILVELQDEGMEIEIDYRPEDFKYERPSYALEEIKKVIIQPGVTIEIKGKNANDYPYEMHK
jgi:hypothetical protein